MPNPAPTVDVDRPVDTKQMAEILTSAGYPLAASSLNKYRVAGSGPPYMKFKRAVRYVPAKALAWAAARTRELTSTSDDRSAA
ncbi:hypothetical protein [Reyranella sp.]|uniref:hypothetical protein n=1 Tax=Reyranella sp. TaxID=1929291 RepID=UPI003D138B56